MYYKLRKKIRKKIPISKQQKNYNIVNSFKKKNILNLKNQSILSVKQSALNSEDLRITSLKDLSFRTNQKKKPKKKTEIIINDKDNLVLETSFNENFNTSLNISTYKDIENSMNSVNVNIENTDSDYKEDTTNRKGFFEGFDKNIKINY